MGWTNSHLRQFLFQKQKQADEAKLGDLIGSPGSKLLYEHDFGDGLATRANVGKDSIQNIRLAGRLRTGRH